MSVVDVLDVTKRVDGMYKKVYGINRNAMSRDHNIALKKYLESLQVVHFKQIGKNRKRFVYKRTLITDKKFLVPYYMRDYLKEFCKMYGINMSFPLIGNKIDKENNLEFIGDLWVDKIELIELISSTFRRTFGTTLSLGTGKGKTAILSYMLTILPVSRIVIFVDNVGLGIQMMGDVMKNIKIDREDILLIGGTVESKKEKEDEPVNIGKTKEEDKIYQDIKGGDNIYKRLTIACKISAFNILENNPDYWNTYDIAVFDECHTFCSPKYHRLLTDIIVDYKFALSATVDKYWNHKLINDCCGETINGNEYIKDTEFKIAVHIIRYEGPPEYTQNINNEKTGMLDVNKMAEQFDKDPYRNQLILNLITDALTRHKRVIAISRLNAVLEKTAILLRKAFPDLMIGIINSNYTKEEKRITKEKADIVLTTYGSGSTGLDLANATCMIFLTSYLCNGMQISGRALRGKDCIEVTREYFDIVDSNTKVVRRLAERMKVWKARRAEIREKKIKYQEINL